MTISKRTQKGIIVVYALSLSTAAATIALAPTTHRQSPLDALILAIPAAPAIAFLLGVKWCGFIVGILSILSLGFCTFAALPFVVRPLERIQGFWFLWTYFEIVFIATSIASFAKSSEAKPDR